MSSAQEDDVIKEKLKPFEKWKEKIKDEWRYKQKLVIFEDANGNIVTPSTTTTTTTTTTKKPETTSPVKNVTRYTQPTKFSSVAVVTTADPKTGKVASADTTELIKIVGITCASLIGFLLILVILIRCCRKSRARGKERVTVRRPLHDAEREEHIYAEIEPLQATRSSSPGGASGNSRDVPLPSKKSKKRRGGVSSFRALSTRIYRFFNADTDNQSVFYNRTNHQATVGDIPPEPPQRNDFNGKKTKRVNRFESTASRRPLLDGDSRTDVSPRDSSSSVDTRGNVYNPLLKENEGRAPSGPYDHLTLSKTQSGSMRDSEANPSSPHDYFTLEKTLGDVNSDTDNKQTDSDKMAESNLVNSDTVANENGLHGGIDTIVEESELTETPKNHDYFILEPHEKESKNQSEVNGSIKSNQSSQRSQGSSKNGSPVKDSASKSGVSRSSVDKSPTKLSQTPSGRESSSPYEVAIDIDANNKANESKNVVRSESKDETYVLSKLGEAPEPPEIKNDDEYLSPAKVQRKPDYVDVFPNPPPRSSSLQPHELVDHHQTTDSSSPVKTNVSEKQAMEKTKPVPKQRTSSPAPKSPTHKLPSHNSPTRKSPAHNSPTHKSPTHKPVVSTPSKVETEI